MSPPLHNYSIHTGTTMPPLSTLLSFLFLSAAAAAQHQPCSSTAASAATNFTTDLDIITQAFKYVSGFDPSLISSSAFVVSDCVPSVTSLRLSSADLYGAVSWHLLLNLTSLRLLDLSNNSLKGSLPPSLWSHPSLLHLDLSHNHLGGSISASRPSSLQFLSLSHNRFTHSLNLSSFPHLKALDLSGNALKTLPPGLSGLTRLQRLDISDCNISGTLKPISHLQSLEYLDVSNNRLQGHFPSEFPPLTALKFLNVSINNFTGRIPPGKYPTFGSKSFTQSGIQIQIPKPISNSYRHHPHVKNPLPEQSRGNEVENQSTWKKKKKFVLGLSIGSSAVVVLAAVAALWWRRKASRRTKWSISKPIAQPPYKMEGSGPFSFETESGSSWVADIREPGSAAVVMFEKPLMKLSFKDLVGATSCFGKESQLAEGRCGPLYRGVLPGELHVAIKVLETVRRVDPDEAVALFEELSRLRHPNLLPISGYCIAGKEKLVLYEFMPNGDLHGWLHGLPPGKPNIDDWSTDTWDYHASGDSEAPPLTTVNSPGVLNWATRHRIALGVARGLAFLHHAQTKPVVHGHLVPSNILLGDDLEPRIADFGLHWSGEDGTVSGSTTDDVYSFGLVLIELLTGKPSGSEETVTWFRSLVREGKSVRTLDPKMKLDVESEREAVECLRVGYLCTAEAAEKRPTMQQVVGMLRDASGASSHV